MIIGAHSVIYSTDPEADHRFLRDVLRLPAVDGGGGYLIFGLPPAEASVHPSSTDNLRQELYLLCDNIDMFVSEMRKNSVPCGPVQDQGPLRATRSSAFRFILPRHRRFGSLFSTML